MSDLGSLCTLEEAGNPFTFLSATSAAGARLGFLNSSALFSPHAATACAKGTPERAHVPPPGYGLSPMALGNQTGSVVATTDRLIVAARHSDVRAPNHHTCSYLSASFCMCLYKDISATPGACRSILFSTALQHTLKTHAKLRRNIS